MQEFNDRPRRLLPTRPGVSGSSRLTAAGEDSQTPNTVPPCKDAPHP